jgi:peroxiredoxin Q/BCP
MLRFGVLAWLAAGALGVVPLFAASTKLKVGDLAPDFTLSDQNGQTVRLSRFRGKNAVVLAFYVKASTSG